MQWGGFHNGMYLLACNIEFDVKAGVLDVAHCKIITSGVELLMSHLLRCSYEVYVLHGTAIAGFDDNRIDILRHFGQCTGMTNEVCRWYWQAICLGEGYGH